MIDSVAKPLPIPIPPCEYCGGNYWEWRVAYLRFACAVCRFDFEPIMWIEFVPRKPVRSVIVEFGGER